MILKGGSPNLLDALGKIPRASEKLKKMNAFSYIHWDCNDTFP